MELAVLNELMFAVLLCAQVNTSSTALVATASVAASTTALDRFELIPEGISSDELANLMIVGSHAPVGLRDLRDAVSGVPEAVVMVDEARRAVTRTVIWGGAWLLTAIGVALSAVFIDPSRTELVRVPGLASDALGGVASVERVNPIIAIPVLLGIGHLVSSVGMSIEYWNILRAQRDAISLYNRAVVLEGGAL